MARTKKNLEDINIDDLLNDLDKQYSSTKQLPRIRSNILSLDIVLGGQGIPQGKMIEICSASGVGKSTLMLHASKNLCAQGYRVIWIDTEYATDDDEKKIIETLKIDMISSLSDEVHDDMGFETTQELKEWVDYLNFMYKLISKIEKFLK